MSLGRHRRWRCWLCVRSPCYKRCGGWSSVHTGLQDRAWSRRADLDAVLHHHRAGDARDFTVPISIGVAVALKLPIAFANLIAIGIAHRLAFTNSDR